MDPTSLTKDTGMFFLMGKISSSRLCFVCAAVYIWMSIKGDAVSTSAFPVSLVWNYSRFDTFH